MTFIEELRAMKQDASATQESVIEEIHDYFYGLLYSKDFEDNLKKRFKRAFEEGKSDILLDVEWWPGAGGCTETSFSIDACGTWHPVGDYYHSVCLTHKGVELRAIKDTVVFDLCFLLDYRLRELGLTISTSEDTSGSVSTKRTISVTI